jgi:hypothetical protein
MRVRHNTLTAKPNDPTKDVSANAWNEDHYIEPPTPAEIGAEAVGVAASLVSAHEGAADPHPQYLTSAEGNAAYAPVAHVGAGGTAHANATGSVAGFMSAADKTKLDGVASGATANATDSSLRDRATHTGTQSLDTTTDSATRLAMTSAERTKLSGIAAGATANATDSALRDRATHTGTQAASTISDFAEAVDDRVAALLVAGTNVTLTYNDAGNTLTIAATGGGGATDLGIVSAMRAYTNIF